MSILSDLLKSLFSNIKAFVNVEKIVDKITISNNSFLNFNFNINSNNNLNDEKIKVIDEKINIICTSLNSDEIKHLNSNLLQNFSQKKICFLENDTKASIESVQKFLKLSENEELFTFYKNKIPDHDLEILRAACIVKKAFDTRSDIGHFKQDIWKKYGERGNNITNLYSTGYYDKIKKLYISMSKFSNFKKEKFDEIYEKIVNNSFIIFVKKKMNANDIIEEIEQKLKYKITVIHIHGIGSRNIDTIKKCLIQIEKKYKNINKTVNEENNIIFVELNFYKLNSLNNLP